MISKTRSKLISKSLTAHRQDLAVVPAFLTVSQTTMKFYLVTLAVVLVHRTRSKIWLLPLTQLCPSFSTWAVLAWTIRQHLHQCQQWPHDRQLLGQHGTAGPSAQLNAAAAVDDVTELAKSTRQAPRAQAATAKLASVILMLVVSKTFNLCLYFDHSYWFCC